MASVTFIVTVYSNCYALLYYLMPTTRTTSNRIVQADLLERMDSVEIVFFSE